MPSSTVCSPDRSEIEAPEESASALLQRVILPRPADPTAVRALYLDERSGDQLANTGVLVPAQTEVSFAAHFNAFPASYWRRWTTLRTLRLKLDVEGTGRIDVYRSKADATQIHVHGVLVDGSAGRQQLKIELDLTPFEDGGWCWFDISTDDSTLLVHSGGWYAPQRAPGRAAAVVIPDQGVNKVRDQAGFAQAHNVLGDRLRIIDQPNLGGSGGYARVMYEASENTDCEQILYTDDDIVLEPDSILRAVAFSRFARRPMLVGGQMLQAQARSRLHAWGEVLDRSPMRWDKAPGTEYDHDFAEDSLRETEWMHRRTDVDYNARWFVVSGLDGATVSTADGRGVTYRKRDPRCSLR